MKMVLNKGDEIGYGFGVSDEYDDFVWGLENERTNPKLIEFVENYPNDCGDLQIIEIPDEATDWQIDVVDDGFESVVYVVDGKLYWK